mmetsp:Transcript_2806/g.11464  ORF Transcript_2806/g.11464 Transcript_2806/m.11464 type:complete len:248 (+) Transcript_2806:931-1674(+)
MGAGAAAAAMPMESSAAACAIPCWIMLWMRSTAASTFALGPETWTRRSVWPALFWSIWILTRKVFCRFLIISPPLPMMRPTCATGHPTDAVTASGSAGGAVAIGACVCKAFAKSCAVKRFDAVFASLASCGVSPGTVAGTGAAAGAEPAWRALARSCAVSALAALGSPPWRDCSSAGSCASTSGPSAARADRSSPGAGAGAGAADAGTGVCVCGFLPAKVALWKRFATGSSPLDSSNGRFSPPPTSM